MHSDHLKVWCQWNDIVCKLSKVTLRYPHVWRHVSHLPVLCCLVRNCRVYCVHRARPALLYPLCHLMAASQSYPCIHTDHIYEIQIKSHAMSTLIDVLSESNLAIFSCFHLPVVQVCFFTAPGMGGCEISAQNPGIAKIGLTPPYPNHGTLVDLGDKCLLFGLSYHSVHSVKSTKNLCMG